MKTIDRVTAFFEQGAARRPMVAKPIRVVEGTIERLRRLLDLMEMTPEEIKAKVRVSSIYADGTRLLGPGPASVSRAEDEGGPLVLGFGRFFAGPEAEVLGFGLVDVAGREFYNQPAGGDECEFVINLVYES